MCDEINYIPSIDVMDENKFLKIMKKCNTDITKLCGYENCNERKNNLIN